MNRDISAFIRDAIDCYVSDPEVAWLHLGNAQEQISMTKEAEALEFEIANQKSYEATREAFRERLLDIGGISTEASEYPVISCAEIDRPLEAGALVSSQETFQFMRKKQRLAHLWHVLNVLTWKENQDRKDSQLSRDEVLAIWGQEGILGVTKCSDWEQIEQEYELYIRSKPDFELYLLKKHLDWVEKSVGRVEQDDPISFRESIPDLQPYMYEARWCDLLGFDAACASLCGAILEEALRLKMNFRSKQGSVGDAIEKAAAEGLLTARAADAAREVMRLRNLTAHGKPEFNSRPEDSKKSSFPLTRKLLETIFEDES